LRLAFAADLTSTGVYVPVVAVRASLAERFSGAVRFDITSGLTPYLTQDCNALYYTASDNFVHRVTR
jgi:hypothetical protein